LLCPHVHSIFGNPKFKEGIASLYETIQAEDITTTHGAIGANHLVLYSLVFSIASSQARNYFQVSAHAASPLLGKKPESNTVADTLVVQTKMIIINNPNNPSGALIDRGMLEEIIEIARAADAYILSDETYRGLTQEEVESPSIADMYEKVLKRSQLVPRQSCRS
jgi:aspartate/methionine/tyrosine aminotransferase